MERPASGGLPRPLPHDPDGERIDPYGFERAHDYESYKEMMNEYVAVLNRRSLRWSKLLQESPHIEKNLTVKRYVRKGVPSEHRSRIWMAASGAQEQLESRPGYYRSLLAARHQAPLTETIHADIHRTFPDNILFKSEASLQSSLFNVLVAYGHHNEAVGYCQGMNFIAGYLIIITKDEEKSFWLMDALLAKMLPDYYSPSMLGLKADVEVLSELVKMKSPAVGQLMAQYPGIWMLVVSRWFICLYVDVLPIETVLRVWDCLFYEGSKVLFRVALTLIMHHQPEILRARSLPDVCQCFRQITCGAFSLECHSFMQRIFTEPGSLSMTTVQKLREKCTKQIQEEESGRS
ncbi:growth hormone-regulated TBC protein 1-A-like isoform X1 [Takifugu flavidus]|uniref:growth hormone-regulated TBC protein 1-A-like isoform X1 n=1 Tax=Takifugu flavidus TaxID=433684 RepID=UPI0025443C12|nr:growth hormone-regulated TBC protein 1-A-like isoform X1 [Takifugu flavidus]